MTMPYITLLGTTSGEAHVLRDHFFILFLSPDFHELWHSVMSTSLFTEVKWQRTRQNWDG